MIIGNQRVRYVIRTHFYAHEFQMKLKHFIFHSYY